MCSPKVGAWLVLVCLSFALADDTTNSQGTDNKPVKLATDDLIDLDESITTGNESIIESANGKIIFETFPTKLQTSHDIISDDVDTLAGSGSGTDGDAVNITETAKFTVLPIAEAKQTTTTASTSPPEEIKHSVEESDEDEDDDDEDGEEDDVFTTTKKTVTEKTETEAPDDIQESEWPKRQGSLWHANNDKIYLEGTEYVSTEQMINLTCIASGPFRAPDDIDWFHTGNIVHQGDIKWNGRLKIHVRQPDVPGRSLVSQLIIQYSKLEDGGNYVCRSPDGITTDIDVHVLNVDKKAKDSTVDPNSFTRTKGDLNLNNITVDKKAEESTEDPNFVRLCEEKQCQYGGTCVWSSVDQVGCSCPMQCGDEFGNEICGSDGVFYPSPCLMEQRACEQQRNITLADYTVCAPHQLPCSEVEVPAWSSWSIWLQSGSNDFRFRYCKVGDVVSDSYANCGNELIEVKPCKQDQTKECRDSNNRNSKNFNYACAGADFQDIKSIDQLFNGKLEDEVSCKFSIYDAGLAKFVHINWSYETLLEKGDPVIWCSHRGIFIPFLTEVRSCKTKLDRFCSSIKDPECKPRKKVLKNKGERKHKCWKKFLLDGSAPQGFPNFTEKYYICQRFAPGAVIGDVFGDKNTYYSTVYDSEKRIPLMSFGRYRDLGDETWPAVPYMLEKGLLPTGYSFISMFFEEKRKGMFHRNLQKEDQTSICESGRNQALESDYTDTTYNLIQLLPPDVIGYDVGKRISTFTLTNTVPIHASLYSSWKQTFKKIRKFSIESCNVPEVFNSDQKKKRRQSHDFPEIYIISGAVPSTNPPKYMNDRVNIPYLVWTAVCCVRGGETSSFSTYVRNDVESPIIIAPVVQLEVLLSDLYNDENQPSVKLFPAFGGVCSDIQHDVSQEITQ